MKKIKIQDRTMKIHGKPQARVIAKAIEIADLFCSGTIQSRKLSNGMFSVLEVSRTERIVIDGEDLHLMSHEKYNLFVNQR